MMPIVTVGYYKTLCQAVEEVAEDLTETKGLAYMPAEMKERLAKAAIKVLKAVDVEVKVFEWD